MLAPTVFALFACSTLLAVASTDVHEPRTRMTRVHKGKCSSGAAYLISNTVNGSNFVIAVPMNSKGVLDKPVKLFATGGMGGVGTVANGEYLSK